MASSISASSVKNVVNFFHQPQSCLAIGISLGAISVFAGQWFAAHYGPRWGESTRAQLGRWALKIPAIRARFEQEVEKEYRNFCSKTLESWKKYGEPIVALPEEGWSLSDLIALVDRYAKVTNEPLRGVHFSGTVYFNDKMLADKQLQMPVAAKMSESDQLAYKLRQIFNWSFDHAFLWNSLHDDEFGIGYFIDYQVVRMVADMFGGKKEEVMGFVTSGGTESLMVAARAYREWGIKEKGHGPGESVIIAGDTVHAALLKASAAYLIKVVLVEADESGSLDYENLEKSLKKYGSKVVAIVGSAPSYPTGAMDDILRLGALAQQYGCGMHVDACLGGFIINHLDSNTQFLQMAGVTSLSCDTHKNGWAPKGSSVLVTKDIGGHHLAKYAFYTVPGWRGGVYGSPKDAGSQAVMPSLHALLALLGMGKGGYRRLALQIKSCVTELSQKISAQFQGEIEILNNCKYNVIALRIHPALQWREGATYALAHEMKKRGFVLNNLKNDCAHFCVTGRFVSEKGAYRLWITAFQQSLAAVKQMQLEGKAFPGDAGLYGTISAALEPDSDKQGAAKYIENWLLGQAGVDEAVRSYFLAKLST